MRDYTDLIERLNGIYRVPIRDGLGPVGAGEEPDNPDAFVRRFEVAPINKEAAAAIEELLERVRQLTPQISGDEDEVHLVWPNLMLSIDEFPAYAVYRYDKWHPGKWTFGEFNVQVAQEMSEALSLADATDRATPQPAPATTVDDAVVLHSGDGP